MGRPVNDRYFGDPSAKSGPQFFVQADIGAGEEQCFIVSQRSTSIFRVESVNSGNQAEVQLVNGPAEVTGAGFGYIEAGGSGGNQEINAVSVNAAGSGYSVSDTVTIDGGTGTSATADVDSVIPVNAQDETNYDGAGSNGTFTAGSGYSVSDTITLSDGTVVTVDAVSVGAVTQFTVDSSGATTGQTADGATLTQSATSGGGTGFDLTLGTANQAVFAVSVATQGDYSALPSSPATTTGGTGTGLTVNIDSTSSTADVYVRKLSNKNLVLFDSGVGRETYAINNDPIAGQALSPTRNVSGS